MDTVIGSLTVRQSTILYGASECLLLLIAFIERAILRSRADSLLSHVKRAIKKKERKRKEKKKEKEKKKKKRLLM